MVAERHGIGTGVDEIAVDGFGDAEAAGRVLAVDDDAVELPVGDQAGQPFDHDGPAAAPDDIAHEQEAHRLKLRNR